MKLHFSTVLGCIIGLLGTGLAAPTWPAAIDELEDVMFLNTGYRSRGFSSHITPCSFSEFGPGRQTAAEWLRIGFHDMSTTNVFFEPHGGIDGSIAFELQSGENIGAGFETTLDTYSGFFNSKLSIADMIALGVYASVRSCGGPIVPMRGGRIDATAAGPIGVPQPQNGQGIFVNQFSRMGFNISDMIQMVACGHTLGGVHAGDFPNIVTPGTAPDDFQLFDTTLEFDNSISVQYVNNETSDPLVVGPSVANTRDSDFAVFTADKNVTIKAMAEVQTFQSVCSSILQRMIETVPPAVALSDIIQPYEVKPTSLQLTLLSGGTQIQFSGDIRVRTTVRSALQISAVQLLYKDRTGGNNCGSCSITSSISGTADGFDDIFSFYTFSSNLPSVSSISSFTVVVTLTDGTTETYDNNGGGFPIQDSVIIQTPQSCINNGNLTVFAAVRSSVTTPVSVSVTQKVPRISGTPVPALVNTSVPMIQGSTIGPYNIYSTSYSISSPIGTKYGVSSGNFADDFKDPASLGSTCVPLGSSAPSNSSSSSSATSTSSSGSKSSIQVSSTLMTSSISSTKVSTSSSAGTSASPTLHIVPSAGPYNYLGCYTEGEGVRALAAAFYPSDAQTIESCVAACSPYKYAGAEYGRECWCADLIGAGSVATADSDCSITCAGSPYEYCGAGNRLNVYINNSTNITTPTAPTIKPNIGGFAYYGCRTEGDGLRALTGAVSFNYNAMTLEMCAENCAGYKYWGVEYGGECYCGNSLDSGSTVAPEGDNGCNFLCPGDNSEFCGAGDRLTSYFSDT